MSQFLTKQNVRFYWTPNYRGEVAERWCYADGGGEVGVIASVTQAFCQDCTRARLSTDDKLCNCSFENSRGLDLRAPLRLSNGDGALTVLISTHWPVADG